MLIIIIPIIWPFLFLWMLHDRSLHEDWFQLSTKSGILGEITPFNSKLLYLLETLFFLYVSFFRICDIFYGKCEKFKSPYLFTFMFWIWKNVLAFFFVGSVYFNLLTIDIHKLLSIFNSLCFFNYNTSSYHLPCEIVLIIHSHALGFASYLLCTRLFTFKFALLVI